MYGDNMYGDNMYGDNMYGDTNDVMLVTVEFIYKYTSLLVRHCVLSEAVSSL